MKNKHFLSRVALLLTLGFSAAAPAWAQLDKYKDYREVYRDTVDAAPQSRIFVQQDTVINPNQVVMNSFGRNWFVYGTAGAHTYIGDFSRDGAFSGTVSPDFGVGIGKWFVPGLALKPSEFPEMLHYVGQTLITTDGTTLLGADDKAGVAEIMDAVQYIVNHPEFKHGPVKIGFTPDEEIGRGVAKFDVPRFGADFGYTMDGGEIGELEFENFNAASAKVRIQGRNVHPGSAKGKMRNAILIGQEFNTLLPVEQRPEYTEGYEGFFHLISFKGTVEEADFAYIIRDHDRTRFEAKKVLIGQVADFINTKYGEGTATVTVRDQYYNMREEVEPHYHIIEKAVKAMEMAGIKPKIQPIRGGTDGANLSFKGLPCPNLFAGGLNFHGKMEFVPLESIEAASKVILNLISLYAG